jgi:hypothetical protein
LLLSSDSPRERIAIGIRPDCFQAYRFMGAAIKAPL